MELVRTNISNFDVTYLNLPEVDRIALRNGLIGSRMYAIDLQYTAFESNLTRERQQVGFAATTTNMGLSTASTIVDPARTKSILSGLATVVAGTRSAYNDEVLLARTIQNIQTQMRAERDRVGTRIIEGMRMSTAVYPLGLAMSDLEDYYRAGTLTSGVLSVSEVVNKDAAAAEVQKSKVTTLVRTSDPFAQAIRNYLYPNGVNIDRERQAHLNNLRRELGIAIPLAVLFEDASDRSYAAERAQLAQRAGITP